MRERDWNVLFGDEKCIEQKKVHAVIFYNFIPTKFLYDVTKNRDIDFVFAWFLYHLR